MWSRRIDTYRIDRAIHPDAAGKFLNALDRIGRVEVDRFSSLVARHFEAGRDRINSNHTASAHVQRTRDRELAYRSAAEHRNGMAWMNPGDIGAEVPGGENVREKNGLVVIDHLRELEHSHVGEWNPYELRLHAVKVSCAFRASEECRALAFRIGMVALRVVSSAAVGTIAAGNGRQQQNAISGNEVRDR